MGDGGVHLIQKTTPSSSVLCHHYNSDVALEVCVLLVP